MSSTGSKKVNGEMGGAGSKKLHFERKNKKNGAPNPKYVDLLEVDKQIAGQNFGVFSFISPENIIKQKDMFYFQEFLKTWEMNKSMEKFHQFLNFIAFKYKLTFEDIMKDFETFVKDEREEIIKSSIEDDFKTFLDKEEDKMQKLFNAKHSFQTSTRGFKAGGNFESQEEAELRAKLLRETDSSFDIFVGPIGTWLPWEPEAYKTGRVEYLEEELNQLVKEKRTNEAASKVAFDQRVKESKEKAVEDNKQNAEKFGNKITQDIDSDGNLIGVGVNTQESSLTTSDKNLSVADIHTELFNTDTVVVGKTDYGQSSLVNDPFGKKED